VALIQCYIAVVISLLPCIEVELQVYPVFASVILNFSLPVSRSIFFDTTIEFLDPENMQLTVGISFLSSIQAEIQVLPVWQPSSSISDFRFQDRA
jgi:hypothetical protein